MDDELPPFEIRRPTIQVGDVAVTAEVAERVPEDEVGALEVFLHDCHPLLSRDRRKIV